MHFTGLNFKLTECIEKKIDWVVKSDYCSVNITNAHKLLPDQLNVLILDGVKTRCCRFSLLSGILSFYFLLWLMWLASRALANSTS